MQRMYAPWRATYLSGEAAPDGGGCFLCEAAACDPRDPSALRERLVVDVTERAVVLLNRWPYNNLHLLVAPRAHGGEPDALPAETWQATTDLLWRARRALADAAAPDGFNVGLNLGRAAGAGVPDHLHWHLVPRWEGDHNFMTAVNETRVIGQAMEDAWRQVTDHWPKADS